MFFGFTLGIVPAKVVYFILNRSRFKNFILSAPFSFFLMNLFKLIKNNFMSTAFTQDSVITVGAVCVCVQPVCCRPWPYWSVLRCTRWSDCSTYVRCACVRTFRACPVGSWLRQASAWYGYSAGQRSVCVCPDSDISKTHGFQRDLNSCLLIVSATTQSSCTSGSSTSSPTTTWSSVINQTSWSSQVSLNRASRSFYARTRHF